MKKMLYLLLAVFALTACNDNNTEKEYTPSKNNEYNKKIVGVWKQVDTSLDFEGTFILNEDFTFTHYETNLNTGNRIFYYEDKEYKLNKQGLFFNDSYEASYYYKLEYVDTLYIKFGFLSLSEYDKCYRVK